MALLDRFNTARYNADYRNRLQQAICEAAVQINGEAAAGRTATHILKRGNLAIQTLHNPSLIMERFCHAVSGVLGDNPNPTDVQISNSVAGVWDDVAGVTAADQV